MYHLDRRKQPSGHALVALLAVMSFTTAGLGLGYWAGRYADLPETTTTTSPLTAAIAAVRSGSPESEVVSEIDALTTRLGDLQAEIMRLNALGERMVTATGLDPEEFDFSNPPPQGGPDTGSPIKDYTIKEIATELGGMVSLLKDRKRKLDILEEAVIERRLTAQSIPSGWPVTKGYITSNYGFRIHPIKRKRIFHNGVDFAAPRGTPILAVADGIVTFAGKKGGYGRIVELKHVDGLVTRYAHNNANLVKEGQQVRQGQKIATVGSSGSATGPHVHFEVLRNGEHQNPMRYAGHKAPTTVKTGRSG